jgi:hypothetical protein
MRPVLLALVLAAAAAAQCQPPLRMTPVDPPAGRIRRAVMPIGAARSLHWCVPAAGTPSDAALRDIRSAGADGIVQDGATDDLTSRARTAELLTTGTAEFEGQTSGTVAAALGALLARSGPGGKPSAFAKTIGEWIRDSNTSRTTLAFAVPQDAAITSAAAARMAGGDPTVAGRLVGIASLVCAALPGSAAWQQDQLQGAGGADPQSPAVALRRGALAARNLCRALREGWYSILVADDEDEIFAFARVLPDSVAMVVVNNADRDRTVQVPGSRLTARGAKTGMVLKAAALAAPAKGTRGGMVEPTATVTLEAGTMAVNLPPCSALLMVSDR